MRRNTGQFVDPTLQAAVRRAWAGERASASLRDRVRLLMVGAEESGTIQQAQSWWTGRKQVYAIAASILLVVGLLGYEYTVLFPNKLAVSTYALGPQVPEQLAADLVAGQPTIVTLGRTQAQAQADFVAMGKQLQEKLGQRVFAHSLRGWTFREQSLVQVEGVTAAQLVFTRGNQIVSVLSMPAQGLNLGPYGIGEATQGDCHVAAFIHSSGLYAVVGSSPDGKLTMADVRGIRQQVRLAVSNPITSLMAPPSNLGTILP